jgi:hypothetical protein
MRKLRRCCEWKNSSLGRIEQSLPDLSTMGASVSGMTGVFFALLTYVALCDQQSSRGGKSLSPGKVSRKVCALAHITNALQMRYPVSQMAH